tara:strand:- start:2208 stop:3131 length:924 start_codon:yes stop_codon:yes gene_type:complete
MKKKILIVSGGFSKEREISKKTAKSVFKELKNHSNYDVEICEPDGNLVNKLKKFKPNVVFNALHGQYGEDGYIQSIFEKEGFSYTHSGVAASALAIDKELSKKIFIKNKILTPKYLKYKFVEKTDKVELRKKLKKKIKFPIVIKPINEGSSVNVYICNEKNFYSKLNKLREYHEVLIEEYIPGREIQAAIMGVKKLGAIELKPKRKFYDYKAKYETSAKTEHIIPVPINKKQYKKLMDTALKAHKIIGCKGITRCDFRFYKNKFYLLEINTQPGLTTLSLVPEIAKYNNISFSNLIQWIITDASKNR